MSEKVLERLRVVVELDPDERQVLETLLQRRWTDVERRLYEKIKNAR